MTLKSKKFESYLLCRQPCKSYIINYYSIHRRVFLIILIEWCAQMYLFHKDSGANRGNKSVPSESFLPLAYLVHILLCAKEVLFHELYLSVSSALWLQGFWRQALPMGAVFQVFHSLYHSSHSLHHSEFYFQQKRSLIVNHHCYRIVLCFYTFWPKFYDYIQNGYFSIQ